MTDIAITGNTLWGSVILLDAVITAAGIPTASQVVVEAEISSRLPTGRSGAAVSDELGHKDISGVDAHRLTDIELTSQSYTGGLLVDPVRMLITF